MIVRIGCIVEGKGEVEAVPILIRRVAAIHFPELALVIPTPIRLSRNKIAKAGELEQAVGIAVLRLANRGLY